MDEISLVSNKVCVSGIIYLLIILRSSATFPQMIYCTMKYVKWLLTGLRIFFIK